MIDYGTRHSPKTRIALAFLAAGLIMNAAACSGSTETTDTPAPSSSAPEPSATATPAPEDIDDPHQAAVAAFERFMDAFVAASAIPDPASPDLATAATGDALEAVTEALQANLEQGERSEGQPDILTVTVADSALSTDPVQVVIASCQDTTNWVSIDADTGDPVADEEYGRRNIEALVELLDGRWYVTELAVQGIGTC